MDGFCDEAEDSESGCSRRILGVLSASWRFDLFDLNPSNLQVEGKEKRKIRAFDILYCLICLDS